MVEEVSAEASARGVRVLLGRCYESERILPFGPWVAAIRAAQIASSSDVLDRLAPAWRVELARLLPELGTPEVSVLSDRDSYLRLFDALAQLLSTNAAMQPVVVIIEDLHWADEMSTRLLPFLARRLENTAVLFLATARLEEVEEAPALRRALEELAVESRVAQFTLTALSQRETEMLVEALAQRGTQPSVITNVAKGVWALSEGNPFMIVETTQAISEGRITETADGLRLPGRIWEVIVGHLARLSDVSRELVGVAALIGREFEFPVLQAAAGVSARAAARGIEELVRRRVLHGLGERLDFAHVGSARSPARESWRLTGSFSMRVLLGLSRRCTRRILNRKGSASTLPSAYHSLSRAYLLLGRLVEAKGWGDRAVESSPRHPGIAAHALHLLGDIATHPDRFDAEIGEAHYREALALAEPRGMRPLVAHCHLGLGKLYRRTGQREQAQEHLTNATTMYREMGMTYWLEKAEAEMTELGR